MAKRKAHRRKATVHHRRKRVMAGVPARRKRRTKMRGIVRSVKRAASNAGLNKPMNIAALVAGALIAWNYKDDARLVKYIKNDDKGSGGNRYAAIAAVGLGLGAFASKIPGGGKVASKIKGPIQFFLLGAGVAGAAAAIPAFAPKLLPPPHMTGIGMGRATKAAVNELKEWIDQVRPGMNGRAPRAILTGKRASTLTGKRSSTLTGFRNGAMDYDNYNDFSAFT